MAHPVQGFICIDGTFYLHSEEAEYHDVLIEIRKQLKHSLHNPEDSETNFIGFIQNNNELMIDFCDKLMKLSQFIKQCVKEDENALNQEQDKTQEQDETITCSSGERRTRAKSIYSESPNKELGHKSNSGNSRNVESKTNGSESDVEESTSKTTSDSMESDKADIDGETIRFPCDNFTRDRKRTGGWCKNCGNLKSDH